MLGRSWALLGGHGSQGSILGAKRVPKGRHFGRPSGAKIAPKSRCNFRCEKVASEKRFWAMSGRFLVVSVGRFCCFSLGFTKVP